MPMVVEPSVPFLTALPSSLRFLHHHRCVAVASLVLARLLLAVVDLWYMNIHVIGSEAVDCVPVVVGFVRAKPDWVFMHKPTQGNRRQGTKTSHRRNRISANDDIAKLPGLWTVVV